MTEPVKTTPAVIEDRPQPTYEYEAHPLANQFDMIDKGEDGDAAFEGLKTSIAKDGIHQPIKLFEGKILDGRNRYKAAKEVGHRFTSADFEYFRGTAEAARAYVDDVNIQRRHLSKAQKDAIIKRKIAEYPGASNRQIARMCGVSHTRVNNLRKPIGDKKLEGFEKTWEDLSDQQREHFAEKFASDLRELLAEKWKEPSG